MITKPKLKKRVNTNKTRCSPEPGTKTVVDHYIPSQPLRIRQRPFLFLMIASIFFLFSSQSVTVCWATNSSEDKAIRYLKDLSIEDLLNTEVTSVSGKSEKLSEAAAAIFVITDEDIRRSGATSIPEVLRMAPGLQVARINANSWAVTSRGFSDMFANKLLILIDGRSVYTPLFSGVFWDVQDTLLEDVDRIEVIRGPGATLWGANAVNGIINIITKNAKNSQGGMVTAGAGTEERGFGSMRYGAKLGEDCYFKVYAKYFDRDEGSSEAGFNVNDDWDAFRGGFRTDLGISDLDSLTMQGDIYSGNAGITRPFASMESASYLKFYRDDVEISGGNILARWRHTFSESSDLSLQIYYDRTERDDPVFRQDQDTFDADFRHRFRWGSRQEFIWGMGYRLISDKISNSPHFQIRPDSKNFDILSAFAQDEIMLLKDHLWFTLGAKFEDNDFSGFEVQPSGRLLWKPYEFHTIWGAVSRAVRTPSRVDQGMLFDLVIIPPGSLDNPSPYPVMARIEGVKDFDSEEVIAYELGYRVEVTDNLFMDLTTFYNDFDDIYETAEGGIDYSQLPSHIIALYYTGNSGGGETYGAELATTWGPLDWWQMKVAYTYLKVDMDSKPIGDIINGSSPHNQFSIQSIINLPGNMELDVWFRYVDQLPIPRLSVHSYTTLDVHLAWKPIESLELSLVGQNLLDSQHLEFNPMSFPSLATEIERSVYGKLSWHF